MPRWNHGTTAVTRIQRAISLRRRLALQTSLVLLWLGHKNMANSEPSPGLQERDFTEQRNDAFREGVKGLFMMNGGGAVAMLAFLQAIWKENPQLAKYVVWCIAFLATGVFMAGLVQFFRYHASFNFQGGRHRASKVYRFLYLTTAYGSLAAFVVGVSVVVSGAWCTLR